MEKKTNYSIQTLLESRSFLYVLLLIVTICFVSTYTKIYDVKLDMNGDNIHYYALGKALAEGKGFTNTISFSETPHTHFPPGYPDSKRYLALCRYLAAFLFIEKNIGKYHRCFPDLCILFYSCRDIAVCHDHDE